MKTNKGFIGDGAGNFELSTGTGLGAGIKLSYPNNEYKPNLKYHEVVDDIKRLSGQIFTLLEATGLPPNQLKAMKDVIRNYIADTYSTLSERAYPEIDHKNVSIPDGVVPEEISLEDAIGV